jgi:hypothetical protein
MSDSICPRCGIRVPEHVDRCVGCGIDVGFPNVRSASRSEQVAALEGRYAAAKEASTSRGVAALVAVLEARLRTSEAVICKPWGIVNTLIRRDSALLETFHQDIEAEARLPESNDFDLTRAGVDATFFPYYHARIRFAALSIDGRGSLAYGGGCLVLKESSIESRSTVFEENTLVFAKRHHHPAGAPPPPGLTAVWATRAQLGIAKLAGRVEPTMRDNELASLVLAQIGRTDEDDFLEVHIYGPIHRSAVARLTGRMPKTRADRVMVLQLQQDLQAAGVEIEVTA